MVLVYSIFFCMQAMATIQEPPDEAEIVAKDSMETRENKFVILPVIFYSPETKLAMGIYPSYLFRSCDDCRPSSASLPLYYTTRKQFSAAFETDLSLNEDRNSLSGDIYFSKWPNFFYGIGPNSPGEDPEEFTVRQSGLNVNYSRKMMSSFYLGSLLNIARYDYIKYLAGGIMETGELIGSSDGTLVGIGFSTTWDTRDNVMFPMRGEYCRLAISYFGSELKSDYSYDRYHLDLRKYLAVGSTGALAFRAFTSVIDGDPPFWSLNRIGDQIRGYSPVRFIDKSIYAFQAEYRIHSLWRRLGLAVFAGGGGIGNTLSDMKSSDFRFAAGMGFRYMFLPAEKLNIRIDFAKGSESDELYIDIAEAF